MEGLIVVFDGAEVAEPVNGYVKLLRDLPDAGLRAGFARLELSAWELPAVFEFAVAPLCCKALIFLANDCGCDLDCLHEALLLSDRQQSITSSCAGLRRERRPLT